MLPSWIDIGFTLLSTIAPAPGQWRDMDANSERRQPVYYGKWPREIALNLPASRNPGIEAELLPLLENRGLSLARKLTETLDVNSWQVEAWPIEDDHGKRIWAIVRVRANQTSPWIFAHGASEEGVYVFPERHIPITDRIRKILFADFLEFDDLYQKPLFSDCIWTDDTGSRVNGAWIPTASIARMDESICEKISQPPRRDDEAFTIVFSINQEGRIRWPEGLRSEAIPERPALRSTNRIPGELTFPADFRDRYEADLRLLTSDRFQRKNSAQTDNQLVELAEYLESRHHELSLQTEWHCFTWRGISQCNLITKIPGTLPPALNRPVILSDHYDTAFAEDIFRESHHTSRVSVPGADDNASGTAALLRAAETLHAIPHLHDIWLVHLTGEEFPADSLGARRYVSKLLTDGQDLGGVVQLDMIGFSRDPENLFQISVGESELSQELGLIAFGLSRNVAPRLTPKLRDRFDPKSYLYNTDAVVFSNNGYPVILFNERLNAEEHIGRRHYHETTDTPDRIDWAFATGISKIAIETVHRWANRSL